MIMKIWHILNPGRSGINGLSNVVKALSESQRKLNVSSRIVLEKSNSLLEEINDESLTVIDSNSSFEHLLFSEKPDVIFFHSLYSYKHISYSKIAKRNGIPYVIVFHGGASKDNFQKHKLKKTIANKLFFNSFVKNAERVVYLNNGELNRSIFRKVNPNYWIIPNGVSPCATPNLQKSIDPVNIIFIGRMDYHGKGLDVLVKAVKNLYNSEYRQKIKFSLYGYAYDNTVEAWNDFGEFAKYHGPIYGKEKHEMLREANIMILPSRSEGMPLTVLEALSYGIPSIVTPETNMASLLADNNAGWAVLLDPQELSDVIIRAYNEYIVNQYKFIQSAIDLAKKYDWENIAHLSLDLIEKDLFHN